MATSSIYTSKDAMIDSNNPGGNYGDWGQIRINNQEWGLFAFDITSAPAASLVSSVYAYLYSFFSGDGKNTAFKRITGSWTEMGVTYGTKPSVTTTNQYNHYLINSAGYGIYDVTNIYKDAKNAGNEFGFEISSSEALSHYINTKEYASNNPYIYITYTPSDHYYVKTGGNDASDGQSWANAWATVNKAATTVSDGKTVHIGFGTYNAEPVGNKIAPQNAGSSGIKYLCETATTGGGTGSVIVEKN